MRYQYTYMLSCIGALAFLFQMGVVGISGLLVWRQRRRREFRRLSDYKSDGRS